ncbi:TIGR02680 family protein [Frankia sp. AgB1.9]|uniref:TIGR02680 family protein n=1 Tax=unclassified Frankia TaxID=2632575 RepID=UPI001933D19D|nr:MULTISPECIES: TIGR02680 family protein [unclassified Frankia]MBL7487678.1 TIGR02680 family protein [Frankia sp. AgW1.1]MBL7550056.1 TIGR02680 family protein [Frankia sp. AgB1.9]MBL7621749.1 TIGR02680 family protein [Frankia sp. AgB1.8]
MAQDLTRPATAGPATISSDAAPPPVPRRERWQPLRAGLVDLFYYDVEEFHFHDGRLLLRGNNGTGKSKVLALTLPFLLDGELAPHRVEPDGDRNKRMEWNLLLGGRHPHPERLGYTWLEFGRLGVDGTPEYRTIGAGLKAVAGRGIARHWFFVTSQRVGADFSLVGPTRVALTRDKLKEVIEGHGQVYDTASDYRRAVDEALFGLGPHRYETLVNLLIQLRQPQLSKKPDEKLLSRALTEALPPLDPTLVTTVAEAFRGLDEEREVLRALTEAQAATQAFLTHYGRYAQIAAKRFATPPRQAHSRYEQHGRELAEAQAARERAQEALDAAVTRLGELARRAEQLAAQHEALRDSPEMRDAKALGSAEQEAARLARFAAQRAQDSQQAARAVESWRAQLADAQGAVRGDEVSFDAVAEDATRSASSALTGDRHTGVLRELEREEPPYPDARRAGDAIIADQQRAVASLERLLGTAAAATAAAVTARTSLDRITGEQQAVAGRIAVADAQVSERGDQLLEACAAYLRRCVLLRLSDQDLTLAAFADWVDAPDGRSPLATAVDEAARDTTAAIGRRQAAVEARTELARTELAALDEDIERLVAGGHDAPPAAYTRSAPARAGRAGAPLWKAVDFADGVPADHRAGIEAALEAAGILDAWVSPDGHLRDAVTDDVLVAPDRPATGRTLAAVLVPAVDRADQSAAALDDAVLARLLAAIGLDETSAGTWVGVDGRFRNGVLAGSWHKPSATYLGEGAREAARRDRLVRLRAEAEGLRARLATLATAAADLADQQRALAAEHRELPADTALRDAHAALAHEHAARRRVDLEHEQAVALLSTRRTEADAAHAAATEFAGDVGLPTGEAALADVRAALGDYRAALAGLWPAAQALARSRQTQLRATGELDNATMRQAEAREDHEEALAQAQAAAERHRVLVENSGAAVDELFRRLAAVDAELGEGRREEKTARAAERAALDERGRAEGRREALTASIAQAASDREAAIDRLRAFAATGLLAVAVPGLEIPDPAVPWAPNPAIAVARAVNTALDAVDEADRRWELVQQRVSAEHKVLTDALSRHGHTVGMVVADGVIVVDVLFQGRRQDVPALVEALVAETEQRALLLSAKEREILENHLVNEVAGALQELISSAEEQVRQINAALETRPTSTGMRLRLQWRTARTAPDGLTPVRDRLLRQTTDAWSAADRAAVGAFLQDEIGKEHSADTSGGWAEQLTRALDYRRWHEFAVQRFQDGVWRTATGPASGGERVLAASVPLFAAASSFYDSAGSQRAPRLIALDEAFAGVDDDSRAKCLGLLAAFDLDVVMTSEREWGCYPEVPGLAIAQLSRRDGVDAVLVTPWRWDGSARSRLSRPAPRLPEPPRAAQDAPDADALLPFD